MLWFLSTGVMLLIAVAGYFVARHKVKIRRSPNISSVKRFSDESSSVEDQTPKFRQPYKWHGRGMMIGALILWVIVTVVMSVVPVKAGEVGIVRQFGSIVGQVDEGVNFIAPWQAVDMVSIRTERHTFGTVAEPITAASSETQDVYVIATINYSVSESDVQDLIRNVGTNWFDILVPTRVHQYIKQETSKYKTIEIIPNREEIRRAVLARLQNDLGSNYSITISDLLLDNISFSPEFTQAIENKQVATEEAQAEENRTETVRAQAEQARVRAQGEADSVVIAATGQAEANELISESLTPELLQWQAIQELADNVEIALIPSGEGIIIDPSTVLASQPQDPQAE